MTWIFSTLFFTSLFNLADSATIIGGDFNTVVDPSLDRSNNLNNTRNYQSTETFNSPLLTDPEFDKYVKREWASFLEINDSPEIAPSLLWETGKAVLRGKIIS